MSTKLIIAQLLVIEVFIEELLELLGAVENVTTENVRKGRFPDNRFSDSKKSVEYKLHSKD